MFQLAGYDEATAQKAMKAVMNIETRLAKAARSQVELRDPHANYNKMDMETLKKNFPYFRLGCLLHYIRLKRSERSECWSAGSYERSGRMLLIQYPSMIRKAISSMESD